MKTLYLILVTTFYSLFSYGQTINQIKLDSLLKKAESTNSEAVIIYQEDKLIVEKYYGIGKPSRVIESMSATKSVVGLAVACMLSDKLINSLDVPIHKFYPEWKQGQKQYITLRHIVQMTSGLQNVPIATEEIYPSPDFVKLALAAELSNKPGVMWSYNNKALNLMSGIVKQITGKRMDKYIEDRLFKPLNIKKYNWTKDSAGNPHVMSGCQIRPMDFIKFGLLVLNNGIYNGKEIISSQSIKQVLTPSEQYKGYGVLWWIDYEKTISIVDDESVSILITAGIAKKFTDKAEKMKGVYYSENDYITKIQEVFGDNPWAYINSTLGTNLKIRRKEFSGNITYRADGFLGNYIIVDPQNKIVAIRMTSGESYQNEQDSLGEFKNMVLKLTE